ncbi:MAG: BON domain-containing protein [Pseudobdellovibrionaceae bacterium]
MNQPNRRNNNIFGFVLGVSIGAVAMYFLDPDRGRSRRILVRDKIYRAVRRTQHRMMQMARNASNHSLGLIKDFQSRLNAQDSDDATLELRVRSSIGRKVSHAKAIKVTAQNGVVTLSGPILRREVKPLIVCVENVPGVKSVVNQLEKHERSDEISSLQGKGAAYFQ